MTKNLQRISALMIIVTMMELIQCASSTSEWTTVTLDLKYAHDMETTPLQIKTDSADEGGDMMAMTFFSSDDTALGKIWVSFKNPPMYMIPYCSGEYLDFSDLPAEQNRVWSIRKTATSLEFTCNEVEAVTYSFLTANNAKCVPTWNVAATKVMFVSGKDTASDELKKGTVQF